MPTLIQLRRDLAANWTADNPILELGEPGYETDTGKLKVGDGATGWNALAYYNAAAAAGLRPTAVKTSAYTAAPSDFVPVDASAASVVVTLPTAPADQTRIGVKLVGVSGAFGCTIGTGGGDVFNKAGGSITLPLSLLFQGVLLQYSASTGVWYVQADDLPLSQLDLRYLQLSTGGTLAGALSFGGNLAPQEYHISKGSLASDTTGTGEQTSPFATYAKAKTIGDGTGNPYVIVGHYGTFDQGTTGLVLNKDYCGFRGIGKLLTTLKYSGTGQAFTVGNGTLTHEPFLEGFTLDVTGAGVGWAGLVLDNAYNGTYRDIWVNANGNTHAGSSIKVVGSNAKSTFHNTFRDADSTSSTLGDCVFVGDECNNTQFFGGKYDGAGYSVRAQPTTTATDTCKWWGTAMQTDTSASDGGVGAAFVSLGGGGAGVSYFSFIGCRLEPGGTGPVMLFNHASGTALHNEVIGGTASLSVIYTMTTGDANMIFQPGSQVIKGDPGFSWGVFASRYRVYNLGGSTTASSWDCVCVTAALTVTLPASPTAADKVVVLRNNTAGIITVAANSGQNIVGASSIASGAAVGSNYAGGIVLVYVGSNTWLPESMWGSQWGLAFLTPAGVGVTTATITSPTLSVASGTSAGTTSLSINACPQAMNSGSTLQLVNYPAAGGAPTTQTVTLSGAAAKGDTTLAVNSFTPSMNFPIGTELAPLAAIIPISTMFPGATMLRITTVGGGGGAGGAGSPSSTQLQVGGAGGAAGVTNQQTVALGANTTLTVALGLGGSAGTAGAAGGNTGGIGGVGGATTVTGTGISLTGWQGIPGRQSTATSTASASGGLYGGNSNDFSAVVGNTSGAGCGGASAQGGGSPFMRSAGGGAGGSTATSTNGGAGGGCGVFTGYASRTGGTAGSGANGGNGANAAINSGGGGGGGGAGAAGTGAGGVGGTGGSGLVVFEVVG